MITKMPRLPIRDAAGITILAISTILYFTAWHYLIESEAPAHAWLLLWSSGMFMLAGWLRASIIIQEIICVPDSKFSR